MRALLAIAGRELRERWALPVATLCFGFAPLWLALRAGERPLPIATVLTVPAAWTLAFLMGASVIARDLADGRLAFFFARPVPWWAIGGGKLLAAVLLTLVTAATGALPSLLADGNPAAAASAFLELAADGRLALFLVLLLALVGLGHAAGVVYRSRSPWAALDFLLAGASIAAGVVMTRALVRWSVVPILPELGVWAGVLLPLAAVALAPVAVQLARGRSDLQRSHRALSLTLWSGVLAVFVIAGSFLAEELAATPADFQHRLVTGATSDGRYVSLLGFRRSGHPQGSASFLLDTASGRFVRNVPRHLPSFAADSPLAVWDELPLWLQLDFAQGYQLREVQLARLAASRPEVEPVRLETPAPSVGILQLALAPRGERVAILSRQTLSVHELPSGRDVSRTTASDGDWIAAAFLPDGRLRALRRVRAVAGSPTRPFMPGYIEVVELSAGVPSQAVRLDAVGHAVLLSDPAAPHILLNELQTPRVISLHDAQSGERLRRFVADPGATVSNARLLSDGRVALLEGGHDSSRLRLAEGGGTDVLVPLPAGLPVLGNELPGGRLAIGLLRSPEAAPARERGDTLIVSLASGELQRRETGLLPASHAFSLSWRAASPAAALFVTDAGALVRLDPETGDRHEVLRAPVAR